MKGITYASNSRFDAYKRKNKTLLKIVINEYSIKLKSKKFLDETYPAHLDPPGELPFSLYMYFQTTSNAI